MPPADSVTVEQPKHALHALTTFELRDYRHHLERAIAFFDGKDPVPRRGSSCKPGLRRCWPSRTNARGWPMPDAGR